ncbi:DMT family transporter [Oscillatoria sp. CS-180]|uniref:DMT family transporter n=1 Tax=Oscillatoria sp. CS-180 TaxID=3021720 RepID=UPI00232D27FE|nr:DMT family transporter [Oscillatoria sp. CS-180]MDB9528488.1 DMT family transporter [Oscillatoria sp. CS-180]
MPKKSTNVITKGPFLFGLAMLISGSVGLLVRLIDLSPINIVFFRCVFGALTLGIYILVFKKSAMRIPRSDLLPILGCGFVLVANWIFLFAAFKQTSITVAVSIYYLAPVFVTLYGLFFLNQTGTKLIILGIFLAFFGAALVSGITIEDILSLNILGASYAFLAAVFYAALILLSKNVKYTDSAMTSLVQTTVGALILSFFANFEIEFADLNWGLVVAIGAVHTALLYILFFHGIRSSPILLVVLLGFIDPLFAILLDRFILGSQISSIQLLGVVCIITALALKAFSENKTEQLTE